MQPVSSAWKNAQLQTIVPKSQVEISYKITDPDASVGAASDNGHTDYSDVTQTTEMQLEGFSKYTTLEHNMWALDGSFSALPPVVTQNTGFVSSVICGDDFAFNPQPVITITYPTVNTNTVPGIYIAWSTAFGECARSFTVRVYNGATLVAQKTVTNNTTIAGNVDFDFANYNRIEIQINSWCLPRRRARVEQITVGRVEVFTNADLLGYAHESSADLLSFTLPKNAIRFELSNIDQEWNPFNDTGLYKYLAERQEISVKYGYEIDGQMEWIKAGTFWLSGWDTPQNGITATFEARDLIVFMNNPFSITAGTYTLMQLATRAFQQSNIPETESGGDRWVIDASLSDISVTIPSGFTHTCAEVVQLCANAALCVMYQDREGIMRVEPLAQALTDYLISQRVSYRNAENTLSKELKGVDVNDGMAITTNANNGETQLVKNELIQNSAVAADVAQWVQDCLKHRRTVSGEYRSDPRLDVMDNITLENKYATNTVFITNINYSYNGAFRGNYEGRVFS